MIFYFSQYILEDIQTVLPFFKLVAVLLEMHRDQFLSDTRKQFSLGLYNIIFMKENFFL